MRLLTVTYESEFHYVNTRGSKMQDAQDTKSYKSNPLSLAYEEKMKYRKPLRYENDLL